MSDEKPDYIRLPWALTGDDDEIQDAEGFTACDVSACQFDGRETLFATMLARRDFILRACNNHAALLAACREAVGYIQGNYERGCRPNWYDAMEAAIAKAEGTS